MHAQKRLMLWIIVLGGIAVVGGYVLWLALNPGRGDALIWPAYFPRIW